MFSLVLLFALLELFLVLTTELDELGLGLLSQPALLLIKLLELLGQASLGMGQVVDLHLGLVQPVLALGQGKPALVLRIAQLLRQLLILQSQVADLSEMCLASRIELFLEKF